MSNADENSTYPVDHDPVEAPADAIAADAPGADTQVSTDEKPVPLEPPAAEDLRSFRFPWKKAIAITSAMVSAIGALWTFWEIKGELFADRSGFSSLRLSAETYPSTTTEWALPINTDLADFPASDGTCGEAQQTWLESRAVPVTATLILDMRNTASEGPMLVVRNINVTGQRESGDPERVLVVCDTAPRSSTLIRSARLDATTDDGLALLQADIFGATTEGLPDTPVTWTLAPGETGQLIVRISSQRNVEGTLTATVHSGEETRLVEIEGGDVSIVPLVDSGFTYLDAGDGLRCTSEVTAERVNCVIEDVLAGTIGMDANSAAGSGAESGDLGGDNNESEG